MNIDEYIFVSFCCKFFFFFSTYRIDFVSHVCFFVVKYLFRVDGAVVGRLLLTLLLLVHGRHGYHRFAVQGVVVDATKCGGAKR